MNAACPADRPALEADVLLLAQQVGNEVLSRPSLVALLPDEALEQVCRSLLTHYIETAELA